MAEVIGIQRIKAAFDYKYVSIPGGGTALIGVVAGLLVVRDMAANATPTVFYVDEFHNTVTYIAGVRDYSFSFSFSSSDIYGVKLSVTNNRTSIGDFVVLYQNLNRL